MKHQKEEHDMPVKLPGTHHGEETLYTSPRNHRAIASNSESVQDSVVATETMSDSMGPSHTSFTLPEELLNDTDDPGTMFNSTTTTNGERDVDYATLSRVDDLPVDDLHQPDPRSSDDTQESVQSIGEQLKSTFQTTSSTEIKQIIICLAHLDLALAKQTHLNNLHEAHTAKNFREQRHLNKDRKLRLRETMKDADAKFAALDSQRMGQEKSVKGCEIRLNSHGLQLQNVKDRGKMLAEGGEWMEGGLVKIEKRCEALQDDVKELKGDNQQLKEQFKALEEEVEMLRGRDAVWERRLAVLEGLFEEREENMNWFKISVNQECVLDAVRFVPGNYRIFSVFH
ncbi:unnamed protein product [Aureobasidium uvarum]|uniref:Uncharacterized protein n=1 Tax=Aureobasidium uvarum TaxID=2773716 RepID=A0A9N8PUU3_9PEZI|nr:unnamed protein product [Aureobasidium uvarum]